MLIHKCYDLRVTRITSLGEHLINNTDGSFYIAALLLITVSNIRKSSSCPLPKTINRNDLLWCHYIFCSIDLGYFGVGYVASDHSLFLFCSIKTSW